MAKQVIPKEIKKNVSEIITKYNAATYKNNESLKYIADFRGKYLDLKRMEGDFTSEIARLTFNGKMDNWDFAIFKHSSDKYDPDETFFPGAKYVDGTIEGALKAGHEAYPPNWSPSEKDMLDLFTLLASAYKQKK